ncbi:FAD-dependent oxidoreductase [Candidatus Poribacteria bacterium]
MEKIGSVAIFGAGIAGMQASLDLAEMGFKVYLIDNKPCIGGTMSQLDKTFPTNDCAMCIMSPKLVDTGRHPNIEIITNAELKSLEGQAGHFSILLNKKPRFIDELKCNGCGDCAEKCPVNVPDEYDEGLGERKAIYRRYPQAIPNLFSIEKAGISPCRDSCPAHVNVQGYIALISVGKYQEAYELIRERHPLPSVCGRICHHPCETACSRKDIDEPVAINYLKRFAADYVLQQDSAETERKQNLRSKKVAIVGAGPAGLTAAEDLANAGYRVTLFEREEQPGGALHTAIPGYRLDKKVLLKEAEIILNHSNIDIQYGQNIGIDKTAHQLREDGYAAVFLATGTPVSKELRIEGVKSQGVLKGVEFLHSVNSGAEIRFDGTVTVIGGGNVATDVARTARRLGATKVQIVCLESRREMPAYPWEIQESLEEGIEIFNSLAPQAVLNQGGRVSGLKCARCVSVFDLEGRFQPQIREKELVTLDSDYLIIAIGQVADKLILEGLNDITLGAGNTIQVDPLTLQTDIEWLFAGGDVVSGPASAVEAVWAGHEAAESIRRFLEDRDLREGRGWNPERIADLPEKPVQRDMRRVMPVMKPEERVRSFQEFELGYDEKIAQEESQRCLNCGVCSECMVCVEACGMEAVNHLMEEEQIELDAGAIILATGHEKFDPAKLDEYGYRRYPNVITSGEFERILSASGPFGGHVVRPSDHKEPKKIAWILCAGSRQMKEEGNAYCSSFCCMYSIKEAVIAKEHAGISEEGGLDCHLYYTDIRAYGKDFDKYYERARDEYGVQFRQARLSLIEEIPGTNDLMVKYVDENDRSKEEQYDLIVLSTGIASNCSNQDISEIANVSLNQFGFFDSMGLFNERTNVEGIYVCGTSSGPRSIPETVATASASASYVSSLLKEERGSLVSQKEYPDERDIELEDARIGVFICHCGINIGSIVDVPQIADHARSLPDVVYSEASLYTCSQDTQERIKEIVEENRINRVIVASCTPKTHEALFQDTLKEVGLNPFLFEFVGIREQCAWVHKEEKEQATEKAKELVAMGVSRARLLTSFQRTPFPVQKKGLVIGGGISGVTAALSLADQGFETYLVERENELGGNLRELYYTLENSDIQGFLEEQIERVKKHSLISVYTGSEVTDVTGYVGNYSTLITERKTQNIELELEHGVIIVATGASEVKTDEYLYDRADSVLTQRELEKRLSRVAECEEEEGLRAGGEVFERVVMIQCVGSRNEERPYCSRVCCQTAIKNSLRIKEGNPAAEVFVFYRDIRTYGYSEEYYQRAREAGVTFIRYDPDEKPEVSEEEDGNLRIRYFDPLLSRKADIETDLLVLSTGMEPSTHEGEKDIRAILKLPVNKEGFFLEAHAKLRPLDFASEGIYLCGAAHSPKSISEAISQAAGAAARAVTMLAKDEIQATGRTVQVKERICGGCGLCVEVCPYDARIIDEETGKSKIIEVLCQGCGVCATACPNGATIQLGFTKEQIYHMLEEVV